MRAYPRVCGATVKGMKYQAHQQGLSPRVRGNLVNDMLPAPFIGPIPACAGQPSSMRIIMVS